MELRHFGLGGLVALRPGKPDLRLGEILDPVIGFLECSKGDATIQALCQVVSKRVSAALASASIKVDRTGVLFVYDDPTDRGIDTGHSCTVTADIQNTRAEAKLLADASLDFSGNPLSVSDPALFVAELPVELSARIDVKERFGTRVLLGGCTHIGSDSFALTGSVQTTAKVAILFSFAPALVRIDPVGNYIFTIRPIVKVAAQLAKTDIDFNISGVSFLNGLVTAILGGTSSLFKAVTSILKGDSLSKVWDNVKQHVLDVAVGSLLSLPFDLLDDLVELLAQLYVDEKKAGIAQAYSGELEKQLRTLISGALGLNANGERQFVLRKDFVDLINRLGDGADIWLPDKPVGYCVKDSECSDGKFCNGLEKCINEKCVAGQRPCSPGEERCVEGSGRFSHLEP
ncbi:hypothetical protein B0T22DRAFT_529023 [Podospora appendiculata]|uniref:Uncharacterized protein n=1 Tax=Podospora appendiculata TaxID=314037 RepID=A0AAE0XDI2_9PEZI|nr:hypothetical protein B0T22DRAFT_529023 [Podospora appendiculata]